MFWGTLVPMHPPARHYPRKRRGLWAWLKQRWLAIFQ